MLIQKTINELAELREKASRRKWRESVGRYISAEGFEDTWYARGPTEVPQTKSQGIADAAFIAQAANQIPTLKAEMDKFVAWLEDEIVYVSEGKYDGRLGASFDKKTLEKVLAKLRGE